MIFQYSPLILLHIISAVITGALTGISWRRWKTPVSKPFTVLMAAVTLWTIGSAIQIMSIDLATNLLALDIEYVGIVTVPVAWFILILYYTGSERYLTRTTLPLLCVIPALSLIFVLTNSLHYLFYEGYVPLLVNGLIIWYSLHGPVFWIHFLYSLTLIFLGIALVVSRLNTTLVFYRRQMVLILLASGIPVIASLAYILDISPVPGFDFTPLTFAISGLILALGILQFRLFSLVPIAHSRIFMVMTDGVIVTSPDGLVVDINPAAARILGRPASTALGKPVDSGTPQLGPLIDRTGENNNTGHDEIQVQVEGITRYFDATCVSLDPVIGTRAGCLLLLRDISSRKRAEMALDTANKKLNLMASITRHDILNKITALNCYLELSGHMTTLPVQNEYLEKEKEIIGIIVEQIEFASEYQKLGVETPQWQDISAIMQRVVAQLDLKSVRLVTDISSVEVYADPLLEKVFYNLMDNALKYGQKITEISITGACNGNSYLITCEDDGVGISADDKKHLFTRGFGKNTGLGLFLSREILAITGIEITENGTPGVGARFEICIQPELFRQPDT